jgi:hypothetical protein
MNTDCVSDEVRKCLEREEDLVKGPGVRAPFALTDDNLVAGRWYMDA